MVGVSVAFAAVPPRGAGSGYVLAIAKVAVLAFLFVRMKTLDVYTMQWSSMLILLFMAEGTVRAMGDPQPSAGLGALEAVISTVYFVAVLAYLRPLKRIAKQARP